MYFFIVLALLWRLFSEIWHYDAPLADVSTWQEKKKKYTSLYIPDLISAYIFYGAREVTWMWFFFFDSVMYSHQSGGRLKEFNVSLWKQRGGGKLKVFYKMYTFCHNCHMDMILYMHLHLLFTFVLIVNAYLLIMEWFLIYCSPEKWTMTSILSCSNTWFQT